MNILILADAFKRPSFTPRLRYLCDYLVRQGHSIQVFTEKWDSIEFDHDYPIHEISFYHLGYISWAIKTLIGMLTNKKDRTFARRILWKTRKEKFDVVFCTTVSTFPLNAAKIVADKLQLKLVIDVRDLAEQIPEHHYKSWRQRIFLPIEKWYSQQDIERRNNVLSVADAVTTISPWHVDFVRSINHNVHLIYNGFDPNVYYFEGIPTESFQINYIGRMYETQDPGLLLKVFRELNLPNCQINFYTNMSAYDRLQQRGVHVYGFLPSTAIADTIRRSSVLLVLTNNATNGMMTIKFFEAIGCEKPVLCIPSDEGMLKQTIKMTNAGLCTSNLQEVKEFILAKYKEWEQTGYTHQDIQNKQLFDRESQAIEFERILNENSRSC